MSPLASTHHVLVASRTAYISRRRADGTLGAADAAEGTASERRQNESRGNGLLTPPPGFGICGVVRG
jgi:hypothetical protein